MKKILPLMMIFAIGAGVGYVGAVWTSGVQAQVQTDIVAPEVARWTNEVIRPLAEDLRALNIKCENTLAQWYAGKNALIKNDNSIIQDGRQNEGVSVLTGVDINSFMAQVAAIVSQFDTAGVSDVIQKPCVRSLEVR